MHARQGQVFTPAAEELIHAERQFRLARRPSLVQVAMIAIAKRHLLPVEADQAVILDRAAAYVACQNPQGLRT